MCSINGIVGDVPGALEMLDRMNEATKHRGPDGTAVWDGRTDGSGDVCFGHNRLAIIDLSAAADQPMTDASGRYTIVFNGEIYNYKELRDGIEGYPWKSAGDTEAILALFARDGVAAFEQLRGMFACAIYDAQTHVFTIVRDSAGIKPLYYANTHGALLFSSEVKGILATDLIPRKIDHDVLRAYLRLRYVPEPHALVAGIEKLPPGTWVQFRNGAEIARGTFGAVPLSPVFAGSFREAARTVEQLVDKAVAAELVSDRPLGVYLSGGLDSTILLDAASRVHPHMETFSLRFAMNEGEESDKFNADADLAKQTAAQYGAKHHEIIFSEQDFLALFDDAMRYLDQPVANATALTQLFLARKTHEHVIVTLAGEGGDEVFGGYPRYRMSRIMDVYQRYVPAFVRALASRLHPKLRMLDTPPGIARVALFEFEKDKMLRGVVASEFLSAAPADAFAVRYLARSDAPDFAALFMDTDRRSWLPDEAFQRADTMNMAAGIESRVPFLNMELVRFASTLPSSWRAGAWQNKRILRAAFAKRLPSHIRRAPKRGFFSPTAKWLRRPAVLAHVREILSPGYHAGTDALLDFPAVEQMLDEHVSGTRYALSTLWTLITLRVWAKQLDVEL